MTDWQSFTHAWEFDNAVEALLDRAIILLQIKASTFRMPSTEYDHDLRAAQTHLERYTFAAENGTPTPRVPITPGMRRRVMARSGGRCRECGATERLSIDHIIPFKKGGTNAEANLRVLCSSCNSRKGGGL